MPQYMLNVWHDEAYEDDDLDSPENQAQLARTSVVVREMQDAGALVFVAGLHDQATATVVRSEGGQVSMTDGPYAETKEQMAGFWIVEAADLDAALEWAAKGSEACGRPVEVRAVHDA